MKALNPNTGTYDEVYVKALDTMPVGAEIDFDGDITDIPAGWEEIANPESYSTSEVKTNKVYDGKPVYRRIFKITSPTTSGNWTVSQTGLGAIVDKLVKFEAFIYRSTFINSMPYYESSTAYAQITFMSNNGNITQRASGDFLNLPVEVIMEYTKTTD